MNLNNNKIIFYYLLFLFSCLYCCNFSQNHKALIDFKTILFCFGGAHSCYVNKFGNLKCFGWNAYGQLGLGDANDRGDQKNELLEYLPYVDIGEGLTVKQISCGFAHTCAISSNDSAKCWGYNWDARLGVGDTNHRGDNPNEMGDKLPAINVGTSGAQPISFITAQRYTCILFDNKKVKCFGVGADGTLGYENSNDIGGSPSHMGDKLPFINFGTGINVTSIHGSAASISNCLIIEGSQLMKCWGRNDYGGLGYGDTINRGNAPNTMGDKLPIVDLGDEDRVKQIEVGFFYTCIIRYDDLLKCFGRNNVGQLGIGSITDVINTNPVNLATTPVGTKKVKMVKVGWDHMCVLLDDSVTLKCVGGNDQGQLGQGDTTNRGNKPSNTLDKIPAIDLGTGPLKILSYGGCAEYMCVVFVNSQKKCFGDGDEGALGTGSTKNVGDGPGEMGKNLKFLRVFGIESGNDD